MPTATGQVTNATNFRADFNADGSVNSADATAVRQNSGTGLGFATDIQPAKATIDSSKERAF